MKFASLTIISACVGLAAGAAQAAAPAHPDFTGVWTNTGRPALGGTTGAPGRRGDEAADAMLPERKAKVAALRALLAPTGDSPGGVCLGYGMPTSMLSSGGYPMEIIQRPEQITIIYEAHSETRRIYFGARNAAPEDRVPGRNGYSSGRWEGNTLVVETDNLVDQDDGNFPHSDQAKIVERYHEEKGPNGERVLVADMTLTDPASYTKPVTAQKRWQQVPNGRLLPYECPEETWHKRLEELRAKAAGK